jgi:hypothetical protein
MTSKSSDAVRFLHGDGLVVERTIKEQVQALVKEGYFDEAESALIGVSNKDAYDARWAGSKFDCLALLGALGKELAR